jgi:hypothetical protein
MTTEMSGNKLVLEPEKIVELLEARPAAVELYYHVLSFFRDDLKVLRMPQRPKREPAALAIINCSNSGNRIMAEINLYRQGAGIDAGLAHELVHELLHLDMICDGFAHLITIESLTSGNLLTRKAKHACNLVGHEIFIERFLLMGFSRAEFVIDEAMPAPDRSLKSYAKGLLADFETGTARALWDIRYLAEVVSHREQLTDYRDEMLAVGSEFFPTTMNADAKFIEHWLDDGEYRTQGEYHRAMNTLFLGIGMPKGKFGRAKLQDDGIQLIPVGDAAI